MLPNGQLSSTPVLVPFTGAKALTNNLLVDYEDGGIALSDNSQGLLYQIWKGTVQNLRNVYFTPENGTDILVYPGAYAVTEISISFDQLMHPYISFVENNRAKLYWYDSAVGAQSVMNLPIDVRCPKIILDDKRDGQSSTSDVLLFYMRGTTFYYRQQRDRFQVEYTLKTNVQGDLLKVGFNTSYRLQFQFGIKMTEDELINGELAKGSPIKSSSIITSASSTTPSDSDIWELERKD